jgi:uncharacterized protein YcbX
MPTLMSVVDERRFRMNFVIDTESDLKDSKYIENEWVSKTLTLGDASVGVTMLDPRCVMVNLCQGEGIPKDNDVLRTLSKNNNKDLGFGTFPCIGVYGILKSGGKVRVGDKVNL